METTRAVVELLVRLFVCKFCKVC